MALDPYTAKTSPKQTEEERRLIREWLAKPSNFKRMIEQKAAYEATIVDHNHGARYPAYSEIWSSIRGSSRRVGGAA